MIRSLNGKTPHVHPTAFVSEFAYVVGDVQIGEQSSIWPGTVIRGDSGKIVIGKNTNIQDNSVIHSDANAWIGDNVTIGHRVVCHARTIANTVLLGNGCVLNDGVEVGEESIVASGAVILERMKFEPRSLIVGAPGKFKARIKDRHLSMIRSVGQHYVQKCRNYKKAGDLE